MKKSLCLIIIAVFTVVVFCGCGNINSPEIAENVNGIKIVFPMEAEEALDLTQVEISYDLNDLNEQMDDYLSKHKAYIFTCPIAADIEGIAARFGFEKDKYFENYGDTRTYYFENPTDTNKRLDIDRYGYFTYIFEEEVDLNGEFKFTDEECVSIAKDFLKEKGLLPENISQTVSFNETSDSVFEDGVQVKTLVAKGVNFFRGEIEDAYVYGVSRITADVNRNGKVDHVIYNYANYEKQEETSLISVEDALAMLKEGDCYALFESKPKEIEINNVTMMYYAQDRDGEKSNIQPVYLFTGTMKGEAIQPEDQAVFMVQANIVK